MSISSEFLLLIACPTVDIVVVRSLSSVCSSVRLSVQWRYGNFRLAGQFSLKKLGLEILEEIVIAEIEVLTIRISFVGGVQLSVVKLLLSTPLTAVASSGTISVCR